MSRLNNRKDDEPRPISIIRHYTRHAEGSVLISFGDTRVLCTASIEERVPPFLRGQKRGWISGEYGMLPRATSTRSDREAARGKQGGRTVEIQRLIGRSLRAAVDARALGERTIMLDCDVLQADGGTRSAAISGAFVALSDAVEWLRRQEFVAGNPLRGKVAAMSVGMVDGRALTDLDYAEDSRAETDMNVVMNERGGIIEVQGTAEGKPFKREAFMQMLDRAQAGIAQVLQAQENALAG